MSERIGNELLKSKVMSADEAAEFINNGDRVGMSGFTGAGYPKGLPTAIAKRAKEATLVAMISASTCSLVLPLT